MHAFHLHSGELSLPNPYESETNCCTRTYTMMHCAHLHKMQNFQRSFNSPPQYHDHHHHHHHHHHASTTTTTALIPRKYHLKQTCKCQGTMRALQILSSRSCFSNCASVAARFCRHRPCGDTCTGSRSACVGTAARLRRTQLPLGVQAAQAAVHCHLHGDAAHVQQRGLDPGARLAHAGEQQALAHKHEDPQRERPLHAHLHPRGSHSQWASVFVIKPKGRPLSVLVLRQHHVPLHSLPLKCRLGRGRGVIFAMLMVTSYTVAVQVV